MADLPPDVIDTAERLTRLARRAVDDTEAAAYRRGRDERLAEYGYVARLCEEAPGAVLVCYPREWVDAGTVRTERIEDLGRAVERPLDGSDEDAGFDRVESHNRSIAETIEDSQGPIHAANAHAFADFMSNHYVRAMESATATHLEEFLTEYFPRNAWPSERQRSTIEESLRLVFRTTSTPPPSIIDESDPPGPESATERGDSDSD